MQIYVLPGSVNGKEPACQSRRFKRPGFDPWVGEDSKEKGMATHSKTLAWRMPWTEEPHRLQSIGSQRVRHDWSDLAHTYANMYSISSKTIYYLHSECPSLENYCCNQQCQFNLYTEYLWKLSSHLGGSSTQVSQNREHQSQNLAKQLQAKSTTS